MTVDQLIQAAEELRLAAYDDATGLPVAAGAHCIGTLTIGYGHTGIDVQPGQLITVEQANDYLRSDVAEARTDAFNALSHFSGSTNQWYMLGEPRQAALIDMAFCLGYPRLREFHNLLAALARCDWIGAHDEVVYGPDKSTPSKWKREVHKRADRDAKIFLTGEWPVTF